VSAHGGVGPADAERVRSLFARHGLTLSALAYYEKPLHPDLARRDEVHRHLEVCNDTAELLGGAQVGTFVGRNPTQTVAENLVDVEKVLTPLVERAGERGVALMVENCPKPDSGRWCCPVTGSGRNWPGCVPKNPLVRTIRRASTLRR
jgi:sugar phosphate isomerase/epimerase